MSWREQHCRKKANRLLARGSNAKAIRLLERVEAWDALADAYQAIGEPKRAAQAAVKAGAHDKAAEMLGRAGDYGAAAEMWLRASKPEFAAEALEQAGDVEAAADLYVSIGMRAKAAQLLVSLGHCAGAGVLYEQAGEAVKAAEMYMAANQPEDAARMLEQVGDYIGAARLHYESGNKDAAAKLFAQGEQHFESAKCLAELGKHQQAGELLEQSAHLLRAAEAYERHHSTLGRSADLFREAIRPQVAWRRELNSSPVCLRVARDGSCVAVGCAARRVQLFQHDGELMWAFKPVSGGVPRCIALSEDCRVAVGCDDSRLYFITKDKQLLWSQMLPAEATRVSVSRAGDRILCCTNNNALLCFDGEGSTIWRYRGRAQIWDVALSGDGRVAAIGAADGLLVLSAADGRLSGRHKHSEWIHSVSLSDDGKTCAVGTGMQTVELIDTEACRAVWSGQDSSPVHNVVLTPRNGVLSVADDTALLRRADGTITGRYEAEERLLGGDIDAEEQFAVFRCVDRKIVRVSLLHCRDRAAINYKNAGNMAAAAVMYEAMGEHAQAAELFRAQGKTLDAARNLEQGGQALDAAELYESGGEFGKAAHIYQDQGRLEKAVACFTQAGDLLKAAGLLEQSGQLEQGAQFFEQAGEFGRAGELYKTAKDTPAAVRALTEHLKLHPDDMERHYELGVLMQENGQYDTAIQQLQRTVTSEHFGRHALMHVAECFVAKNMYDVAINRYRVCLGTNKEVSAQNIDVFYGIGKANELAGNYMEAKSIYEDILAVDYHYLDVGERLKEVEALEMVFSTPTLASSPGAEPTVAPGKNYQLLSSETKDRYAVKKLLGKGGMGEVYLAEDKRLARTVALKVLPPDMGDDKQLRLRMLREAQAVAQISHPNVVAVFDVGEEDGRSYIAMEYVEGRSLQMLLKEEGTFDPKECVLLLVQICEGLGCAHGKGVVHRDMKPANVIVAPDGTAKIMDFGLATMQGATRFTMPGAISGTWGYMAPEQILGSENLGPPVDVYAVGCMTYELLTGHPPFTGDDVGTQHLAVPPKPLKEVRADVPDVLNDIVMKCLVKAPEDRYADALHLKAALQEVQTLL